MLAVKYRGPNVPFCLETTPIPTPPIRDEVIVQVMAASLCHTELHFADGTLNLGINDITMGHEAAGIITAVGPDVDPQRIGEHVVVYYYQGCGICRFCSSGDEQLCPSIKAQHGFTTDGGLAGYLKTTSRQAMFLPPSISFEKGCTIGCGVTTAVHASRMANIQQGEWVVVFGVNGVGFNLIQYVKKIYQAKVIAICRSAAKRAQALLVGADAVIDSSSSSSSVASQVRSLTHGEGADVIFECVGHRTTMDECVGWTGALGRRGRLVFIGYAAGSEHEFRIHPIPLIVYEQRIMGSVGATLDDLKEAIDAVERGDVDPMVDSHLLTISDFQRGLDKMRDCQCMGKVVINSFTSS